MRSEKDGPEVDACRAYTPTEMMAIAAAREIDDGEIVFCGTGIALLAAMAAKHIHAPRSIIFFETGAMDAELQELPLAVGDPRVMHGSVVNGSLADAFGAMQNRFTGRKVVGILGAAQIDLFGNLNSTVIGPYRTPTVRLAGSGGAGDVGAFVQRTVIFMQQEKRKFVQRLDYRTCPGWMDGPGTRRRTGLPEGGPCAVVTNMGVMRFDEISRKMYLAGHFAGITPSQMLRNMGFEVDISRCETVPSPTPTELRILRERCDPDRLILK